MSLQNVDFSAVFRSLAEKRIEKAMEEGKFDNLPGRGQDIVLDDIPAEENARAMWWALKILKQNDFIPDEVRWRKSVDDLKARIHRLEDESLLPALVAKVNELVHRLNTMGTNAIPTNLAPLDLEEERAAFRLRRP